jgi:hypothetical protein
MATTKVSRETELLEMLFGELERFRCLSFRFQGEIALEMDIRSLTFSVAPLESISLKYVENYVWRVVFTPNDPGISGWSTEGCYDQAITTFRGYVVNQLEKLRGDMLERPRADNCTSSSPAQITPEDVCKVALLR